MTKSKLATWNAERQEWDGRSTRRKGKLSAFYAEWEELIHRRKTPEDALASLFVQRYINDNSFKALMLFSEGKSDTRVSREVNQPRVSVYSVRARFTRKMLAAACISGYPVSMTNVFKMFGFRLVKPHIVRDMFIVGDDPQFSTTET